MHPHHVIIQLLCLCISVLCEGRLTTPVYAKTRYIHIHILQLCSVCTYLKHIERKAVYSPKYMYTKNTHTYFIIMFSMHLPEAYRKEGGVFTAH